LISVSKEENNKLTYPTTTRKEGIGPSQYGIKSILGDRFADVEEKYPVPYTQDVTRQQKYMPAASIYLRIWSWTQLIITFFLTIFLFGQIAVLPKPVIFVYGFFIFYTVYCYTSLMDRDKYAWMFELIRCVIAIVIINYYGGWFTLNNFLPLGTTILVVYFIFSTLVSIAFEYLEFKKDIPSVSVDLQ
jgi:hypothetical protein